MEDLCVVVECHRTHPAPTVTWHRCTPPRPSRQTASITAAATSVNRSARSHAVIIATRRPPSQQIRRAHARSHKVRQNPRSPPSTVRVCAPAGDRCPGWRDRSDCICDCIRTRSVRPGSDHAWADDLPILLGWSPLIAGSTTLKASEPRGVRDSNPSARTVLTSINAELDSGAPLSICVGGCISGGIWITGGPSPGDAVSTKSSRGQATRSVPGARPDQEGRAITILWLKRS